MRFQSLNEWLDWQQQLHPSEIELGLDRIQQVYQKLDLKPFKNVITIAGTNGKGSTVAYYENWLANNHYRVASYTSPHILNYNERVKLGLQPVSDEQLCIAFEKVDQARQAIELTYFEFGTLAAFYLISEYQPDYCILEVGLGGRLDAVNIIDADLAHITPIALDHQDWLGETIEQIGYEKSGILRQGGRAVCTDQYPPQSVLETLEKLECESRVAGRDYSYQINQSGIMSWQGADVSLQLTPPLAGDHQAQNLAGVLAGLELLGCLQGKSNEAIVKGFESVQIAGRLQTVENEQLSAKLIVDVGHNAHAARAIRGYLEKKKTARCVVLLGMLKDKDVSAFVAELNPMVDEWWLVPLPSSRGLSAQQLQQRLQGQAADSRIFDCVQAALSDAMSSLDNHDILLATGSFLTVEAVLNSLSS